MNIDELNLEELEEQLKESLHPLIDALKKAIEKIHEQEKDLAFYSEELTKAHKRNTFLEYELHALQDELMKVKQSIPTEKDVSSEIMEVKESPKELNEVKEPECMEEEEERLKGVPGEFIEEEPPIPPMKDEVVLEEEEKKETENERLIRELQSQVKRLREEKKALVAVLHEIKEFLETLL